MSETVKIHIPTALRPQVGDQESVEVTANGGTTVGQALGTLKEQYPDFGKKLYKTDDQLNRFINVYLNDEDIRFLDNLDTPLKAGDEVSIVPAIAGG